MKFMTNLSRKITTMSTRVLEQGMPSSAKNNTLFEKATIEPKM